MVEEAQTGDNSEHTSARGEGHLTFAWDREESPESLRSKLAEATPERWRELAAWIMREARVDEVWEFLSPREIGENFDALAPHLGRRQELWTYLLKTWRELGRV